MELLVTLIDKFGLFALVPLILLGLLTPTSVLGLVALVLRPRWAGRRLRRLGVRSLLLLAVVIGALWATNHFLFEPIARLLVGRVEAASGVAIEFEGAEGSFFSGDIRLRGARLARSDHASANFDLTVDDLSVELSLLGLLADPVRVDAIEVRGVRGTFSRQSPPEPLPDAGAYVVERLRVDDAVLHVRDETLPTVLDATVTVDSLACDDFRRDLALFDLLFRSQVTGRLDGRPFAHVAREGDDYDSSHWHIEGVPLLLLGSGTGLVEALGGGLVTLEIDSRWHPETEELLEMAWRLQLGPLGGGGSLPFGLGGLPQVAVDWIARQTDLTLTVPLRFPIEHFQRARSFAQTGLLASLAPALGRALLDAVPLPGISGDLLDSPIFEDLRRRFEGLEVVFDEVDAARVEEAREQLRNLVDRFGRETSEAPEVVRERLEREAAQRANELFERFRRQGPDAQ